MITFDYSGPSGELSVVSFRMEISGLFEDGTGITDASLNSVGRALEGVAETLCGHPNSLTGIFVDERRQIPVTP